MLAIAGQRVRPNGIEFILNRFKKVPRAIPGTSAISYIKIEKLEAEIKKWEVKMATEDFIEKAKADPSLYELYDKLKSELTAAMTEWGILI